MQFDKAIIIRDKTRLEQLIERFNSKAQAKFYIESSGGNFKQYEQEHHTFYNALKQVQEAVAKSLKYKILDRSFLPTYIFTETDLIVVIGQDGLVANTAKYVNQLPIVAVNPDPDQYDGVLLPYHANDMNKVISEMLNNKYQVKCITMAEAILHDGQRLLAFNDFYIGAATHVSSRYLITFNGKTENQSSSGIIVSTGAGSTGWLSSIFNMTYNVHKHSHKEEKNLRVKLNWEDEKLMFVVREPFLSHVTQAGIGIGTITKNRALKIESKMPMNGVIFSDGIESDFLNFNSGSIVEIGIAKEKAYLVV
ncbi:sugar kinase [Fulvivirgaceae bacterium BMA10]|uniref:Sugar kinase n=1 Tax=Splendidivirga corallicola TaxID=3051826 RepID=A0ABT8L1M8_9BACT|nr:sugar kinase [Fulvivirgaceae bacterium BMA10]